MNSNRSPFQAKRTGQLGDPLNFRNAVHGPRRQARLDLGHAVRPEQLEVIRVCVARESEHGGDNRLVGSAVQAGEQQPLFLGAGASNQADTESTGWAARAEVASPHTRRAHGERRAGRRETAGVQHHPALQSVFETQEVGHLIAGQVHHFDTGQAHALGVGPRRCLGIEAPLAVIQEQVPFACENEEIEVAVEIHVRGAQCAARS
jgi:hypothetical protein